jgi:predicted transcriptional regulator of viral defense system
MTSPYLKLPVGHYFDYAFLLDAIKEYRSPRDKITLMLKNGEIIRIRKGLYVRSRQFGGVVEADEIANAVYGPSYISLHYALSHYSMIPERVVEITSVTSKRQKTFSTPVGRFSYSHIPVRAYSAGITIEKRGLVGVLMATPEKALCDTLAEASDLRTMHDVEMFIIENQRIDSDEIAGMSLDLLQEIERAYGMERITTFVRWFRKNFIKSGQPR